MGDKLPRAGVETLEASLELAQRILDSWIRFQQILAAYPQAPPVQQGQLEMSFLQIKSQLARDVSVLTRRMHNGQELDSALINVVAGASSLHQTYSQSEVAVKKLHGEWHRAFIALNESVSELEEMLKVVRRGGEVIFNGKRVRLPRNIPWRKIALGASAAAVLIATASGVYISRHFLGVGAPVAGEGYEVDHSLSEEEQIYSMLLTMKSAFEAQDLDRVMSAFADDFRDVEGRDKTMLRALLQTYRTAFGLHQVRLGIDEATVTVNGNRGSLTPIYLNTPEINLTLLVEGEKRGDSWQITFINGI